MYRTEKKDRGSLVVRDNLVSYDRFCTCRVIKSILRISVRGL